MPQLQSKTRHYIGKRKNTTTNEAVGIHQAIPQPKTPVVRKGETQTKKIFNTSIKYLPMSQNSQREDVTPNAQNAGG
jgi:hypothetical protein